MAVAVRTAKIFEGKDPVRWLSNLYDFYNKAAKPEQGESGGGADEHQRRVAEVLEALRLPPVEAVKLREVLEGHRLPDDPAPPSWMEFIEVPSPPPNLEYGVDLTNYLGAVGDSRADMVGCACGSSLGFSVWRLAILGLFGYGVYWMIKRRNRRGEAAPPGATGADPPDNPPPATAAASVQGGADSPARGGRGSPPPASEPPGGATSLDEEDVPPQEVTFRSAV